MDKGSNLIYRNMLFFIVVKQNHIVVSILYLSIIALAISKAKATGEKNHK